MNDSRPALTKIIANPILANNSVISGVRVPRRGGGRLTGVGFVQLGAVIAVDS